MPDPPGGAQTESGELELATEYWELEDGRTVVIVEAPEAGAEGGSDDPGG